MPKTYLLLGTNLADKLGNLSKTLEQLKEKVGTLQKTSAVYETMPWGIENQNIFLNQVICLESQLSPEELLETTQKIEKEMGRVRLEKWGERLIDIDILYYENQIIDIKDLQIPHPQIPFRRFTLVPLVEIAPDFIHPILNISQKTLLENCSDNLGVERLVNELLQR